MNNLKFTNECQPPLVKKVSVVDTLLLIKPGQTATYRCRDLGPQGTVASAVHRLNARGEKFTMESINNGESFAIRRG